MRQSVHLLYPRYDAEALDRFRAMLHPDIDVTAGPDLPATAHCTILVTGRPKREHLLASPKLHTLIVPWAGLSESTRSLLLEFPHIAVHNLHHNALPAAEHAIALLLATAKFLIPMDRSLRAGDWTPRYQPNPSLLLSGRTALVLGYGAIGRRVASLCQGLGMEVMAVRRHGDEPPSGASPAIKVRSLEALPELLPQADVLVVCLPQTPDTTGLLGAAELAQLPPGAVLVNIGRGPIVDEAALYHALHEGTLYAAGLDVWYEYPEDEATRAHTPPSAYPFHELDNVVMSPHRAGGSNETERLRMIHLAELLNAAARGESMPNRVDLQAGY